MLFLLNAWVNIVNKLQEIAFCLEPSVACIQAVLLLRDVNRHTQIVTSVPSEMEMGFSKHEELVWLSDSVYEAGPHVMPDELVLPVVLHNSLILPGMGTHAHTSTTS